MRVLLVQPPIEDFYDTSIRTYPLGLLYLATRVSAIADVVLLDARTGYKPRQLPKHEFHELEPFYRESFTPFSFFSRYRRFGLTSVEMRQIVEKERPDVAAISSMCSAYEKEALEAATAAKEANREIVTVMGGVHATLFPERLLAHPDVDYCVRGEGETPFFELVSALCRGLRPGSDIPGLCFREGGQFHISDPNVETDIDLLPARQYADASRYVINRKKYAFFLTSRGCPFSCAFCGKPPIPYRKRRLDGIAEEIEACAGGGIEAIDFEDDMLNLDKQSFQATLNLLAPKAFTLSAMNGIYPTHMDAATLDLMYSAGFRRLNFSVVDLSESILSAQGRASQKSFMKLLPYLDRSPFLTEVHFIVGLPGQRPADLLDTLCFLMGQRLLLGPSIFYLSPGSPIAASFDSAAAPLARMRSSAMLPVNPLFPRSVTFAFMKLVRFINYTKQLLDRHDGISRASELPVIQAVAADERKQVIFERLLFGKKFVCYEPGRNGPEDEAADPNLVRMFFEKAKGMTIKGYKTDKTLLVDV